MGSIGDFAVVILSSAGVSAALCSALIWLARSWIGERLRSAIQAEYAARLETLKVQLKADADKQLESHKSILQAQNAIELERLRAQLAIAAAERNAQLSGLVPRRFDAIAVTYGNLVRFQQAVAELVQGWEFTGGPTRDARAKEVADAFEAFSTDFRRQRVYLTQQSADRVGAIGQSLLSSANMYTLVISRHQGMYEQWIDVLDRVTNEVPAAMKLLETDLRALLGDRNEERNSANAQAAETE